MKESPRVYFKLKPFVKEVRDLRVECFKDLSNLFAEVFPQMIGKGPIFVWKYIEPRFRTIFVRYAWKAARLGAKYGGIYAGIPRRKVFEGAQRAVKGLIDFELRLHTDLMKRIQKVLQRQFEWFARLVSSAARWHSAAVQGIAQQSFARAAYEIKARIQWVAVMDDWTCPDCRELNGKEFFWSDVAKGLKPIPGFGYVFARSYEDSELIRLIKPKPWLAEKIWVRCGLNCRCHFEFIEYEYEAKKFRPSIAKAVIQRIADAIPSKLDDMLNELQRRTSLEIRQAYERLLPKNPFLKLFALAILNSGRYAPWRKVRPEQFVQRMLKTTFITEAKGLTGALERAWYEYRMRVGRELWEKHRIWDWERFQKALAFPTSADAQHLKFIFPDEVAQRIFSIDAYIDFLGNKVALDPIGALAIPGMATIMEQFITMPVWKRMLSKFRYYKYRMPTFKKVRKYKIRKKDIQVLSYDEFFKTDPPLYCVRKYTAQDAEDLRRWIVKMTKKYPLGSIPAIKKWRFAVSRHGFCSPETMVIGLEKPFSPFVLFHELGHAHFFKLPFAKKLEFVNLFKAIAYFDFLRLKRVYEFVKRADWLKRVDVFRLFRKHFEYWEQQGIERLFKVRIRKVEELKYFLEFMEKFQYSMRTTYEAIRQTGYFTTTRLHVAFDVSEFFADGFARFVLSPTSFISTDIGVGLALSDYFSRHLKAVMATPTRFRAYFRKVRSVVERTIFKLLAEMEMPETVLTAFNTDQFLSQFKFASVAQVRKMADMLWSLFYLAYDRDVLKAKIALSRFFRAVKRRPHKLDVWVARLKEGLREVVEIYTGQKPQPPIPPLDRALWYYLEKQPPGEWE